MPEAKRPIIIRRKVMANGHHGGAWKVAYADFVTALMALFIVLWLLSSSQKVQQAVGGYFRDPTGKGAKPGTSMNGTGRDLTPIKDDMSQLKEKIKSALKLIPHFEQMKGNIEITITEEGLRIELIENSNGMFYESGKPQPTAFGKELLAAIAKQLGRIPNPILIEGHTDAIQYEADGPYTNWELSSDRANAARRVMEEGGLPRDRVVQIRGYADRELRNKARPSDASNRRVSLIVRYMDDPKTLDLNEVNAMAAKASGQHPAPSQVVTKPVAPLPPPPHK